MNLYPMSPQGVFATVQGEGALLGLPMIFIRLAGCDIGCAGCDTDYSVVARLSTDEIVEQVARKFYGGVRWIWITGGEPTLYDLGPLLTTLRRRIPDGRIAMATAGIRSVKMGAVRGGVDFLSVSPHSVDGWVQQSGSQINLVPGLNGLNLHDFLPFAEQCPRRFGHCYVTPCSGKPETLQDCLKWVRIHPQWRLGVQAHLTWGLP